MVQRISHATKIHRKNIMKLTDPDLIEMLENSQFFEEREYEELFGSSFLQRVYTEATEEDAMDRHREKITRRTPRPSLGNNHGHHRGHHAFRGFKPQ